MKAGRVLRVLRAATATVLAGVTAPVGASSPDLFDLPIEQLELIVVTAQKREQYIQDVPISVAAVSGETIADAAIQDLQALSVRLPNVTINQALIDNNLFVRGIGSGVNLGFERSVGTYIDGVYIGRGQLARQPFLDLSRVEVLKGPQGILLGKNTIAGAVSITTARPTIEPEGSADLYLDPEHGETELNLMLSGSLSRALSGRLAVSSRGLDGYYEHLLTGADLVERDQNLARAQLLWEPTDRFDLLVKLERAEFDDTGRANRLARAGPESAFGAFVSSRPVSGFRDGVSETDDTTSDMLVVTANVRLDLGTITLISAYGGYDADIVDDALVTPFYTAPGDDALFLLTTDESFDQLSQEIRLLSPEGGRFDYLVGVYGQRSELDVARNVLWPFGGTSARRTRQDGNSVAAFGQATWHLTSRLRLAAGGRHTREHKEFHRFQVDASPLPDNVSGSIPPFDLRRGESRSTWLVNGQLDLTPTIMGYLSWSSGFKGGGFDESVTRAPEPGETLAELFEFEEETVHAVELGMKLGLADGAAELNFAVFRSTYDDLQTSVFDGISGFNVANAASSVTQGVEVDGRWRLGGRLTLSGSLSYLDAYTDEFPNGPCSQWHARNTSACVNGTRDLADEPLVFAPRWSGTVSIEHVTPIGAGLEARINLDVMYSDEFYTAQDIDPYTRQDAYTRIDLRLGLAAVSGRWDIAVIGRNLTDEEVTGWSNDITLSDTVGRADTYFALLEPPRTLGLQLRARF